MQGGMMPHVIPADDSDEDNQAYTTPPNEAVGFQPVPPEQQAAYNQLRAISLTVPSEANYQAFRHIANQHTRLVEHLENAMNQLPAAGALRQTYDAYRQHYAGRWTDAHHVGVAGTGFIEDVGKWGAKAYGTVKDLFGKKKRGRPKKVIPPPPKLQKEESALEYINRTIPEESDLDYINRTIPDKPHNLQDDLDYIEGLGLGETIRDGFFGT
jgi:hypothetical protein